MGAAGYCAAYEIATHPIELRPDRFPSVFSFGFDDQVIDQLAFSLRGNPISAQHNASLHRSHQVQAQAHAVQKQILIAIQKRAVVESLHMLVESLANIADRRGTENFIQQSGQCLAGLARANA